MANATASVSGNKCTITIPGNPHSVVLIPKTSGHAAWINYCHWTDNTMSPAVKLGEWFAHEAELDIVTNPKNVIDTTTKHGTLTKSTNPAVAVGNMTLEFSHKTDEHSPVTDDALKVSVLNATGDLTLITILAEDGADTNYLDFQMSVIVDDAI